MVEFEFELMPIEDITPWGNPATGERSLSWYALSYGYYRIRVGTEFLLNYDNRAELHVGNRPPPSRTHTWVDYQVARLWDDVLTMLPSVVAPAPAEIDTVLERDRDGIVAYHRKINRWAENSGKDKAESDRRQGLADIATDWCNLLVLDSAYLSPSSDIWMWSTDATVNIAWDNRGREIAGRPAWSAQRGVHRINRSEFLASVSSFSERFLAAMEERAASICDHWDRPDVTIDFEMLATETERRAAWARQMLSLPPSPTPDWDEFAAAMRKVPAP